MAGYWPSSFFCVFVSIFPQNNEKIEEKIALLLGIKLPMPSGRATVNPERAR